MTFLSNIITRSLLLTIAAFASLLAPTIALSDESLDKAAPALWSISDDNSKVYLFGTFHVLPADLEWQTPTILSAMEESPITVLEVDSTSPEQAYKVQSLMQTVGFNAPGESLSAILGADRARTFFTYAETAGIPYQALEPMRPWLAGMTVTITMMMSQGFDLSSGGEVILTNLAQEEGDRILYLETAERQIHALSSLDFHDSIANFDDSLEQLGDLGGQLDSMLVAWANGDIEAIERSVNDQMKNSSEKVYDALFTTRNQEWIEPILGLLGGQDNAFVGVGAGHLVGDDSVLAMLEERGLKVERLQ